MALVSGQAAFSRIFADKLDVEERLWIGIDVSRYSMMAPVRPATLPNAMRRNGCGCGEEPLVRLLSKLSPD